MYRSRFVLLIISLALILQGCTTLENVLNFTKPTAKVERVELTGLNFDRADLLFTVRVENPNPVGIRLAGLDYDLLIEEGSIVNGDLQKGLELEANGSSIVEIPVSLGYSAVFDTVQNAREKDELAYAMQLGLGFAIPGLGTIRVPLEHRGELPVPRLPKLRIESLRVSRISLTRIDLEIAMGVNNPNAFDLLFRNFSYDLTVGGRNWVSGRDVRSLSFDSKSESVAVLPLSLNIVEVGRSVVDMLSGNRELDYGFSGSMLIDTDLPLLKDYPFSFDTRGEAEVFR